ncbi:MAG: hypothetical protein ACTSSH_10080 [Candidatus Heimdallarchaeota archaeon]
MTANYVLKKMARIHCAKGPKRCRTCKKYAKDKKLALLDIAPDNHPMAARPMIELDVEGEKTFLPFDVIAYFDTVEEAQEYAEKNDLIFDLISNED